MVLTAGQPGNDFGEVIPTVVAGRKSERNGQMNGASTIRAVVFDMDGVLSDSMVSSRSEAVPGAVELVGACKTAGLKVAIVSSADRIKIDVTLNKIGLPPEQWDAIVTADDAVQKKPAPDIYLAAAHKLGTLPGQCVVIEGAPGGVQAAKAAGMHCVAVAQSFPEEQLQAADLVKLKISEISLDDLAAFGVGGSGNVVALRGSALEGSRGAGNGSGGRGPWGLWATLGLALVIGAVFVLAQIVAGILAGFGVMATGGAEALRDPKQLESNGLFLALTTCGAAPAAIVATCLFAWLRRGMSIRDYLRLKAVPARVLFRWCLVLLALAVLSDGLTSLLGRPIVPEVVVTSYRTAWFPPLLWLAVVVLAPLNEEIFFRGFIFAGISRSRMGGWGAILLTSVLWAVIHVQYDWYGVATIFASGLLLGYARLRTNSIIPTIAMHALMNLVTTIQVATLLRIVGGSD